ncbi:hypothetical protein BsWGS_02696 [Bradybaena similaris]
MFPHDNIHPSPANSAGEPMDSLHESTDLSAVKPAEANNYKVSASTLEMEHLSASDDDTDLDFDTLWQACLLARDIQHPSPANSTGEPVDSLHESADQEQNLLDEQFEDQSEPEFIEIILNRKQDDLHSEASDAACDSNRVIADLVYRRTVTNGAVSEEYLRRPDIYLETVLNNRHFLGKDLKDGSTEYFVTRADKDVHQITKS